jgi:hypothetical protein
MRNKWYAKTNSNQGLVIEETTGKTIAVSFEKEDCLLLAKSPDMLSLLKDIKLALECGGLRKQKAWLRAINDCIYELP